MKRIIGTLILVSLFAGIFVSCAIQSSVTIASVAFATTAVIVFFTWVAVVLIDW